MDWGDGNSENWFGPFESGMPVSVNHTWTVKLTAGYIRVQAKDEHGAESDWGQLFYIVIISKGTNSRNHVFLTILNRIVNNFLERHPRLQAFIYNIIENIMSRFENIIEPKVTAAEFKV